MKNFFEWLYFDEGEKIVKIKGWNTFLVDTKGGSRRTYSPVWNWSRVKHTLAKMLKGGGE